MNRLKWFFSKFRIKSLYVKWILLFTGLILIAQIFTLALVTRYMVPEIVSSIEARIYRKAEFLQQLYQQGFEITEVTLSEIGDMDLDFYLLSDTYDLSEEKSRYNEVISLGMLQRAKEGEIVLSDLRRLPFCLVAVNDQVALLAPNIHNNEYATVIIGMQRSLFMGGLIGSILIVGALIVVIRPIKKVTAATREVANGNFNVKLQTKSVDEVGQLIENFNRMAASLQKNEYLKKDFVSSVSHEFKTPITSIEGFANLLKSNTLTKEQLDDYTDIIIKETGRLSNLSSNLLKLSVLDSSEFEPTKSEFYLDEQIRNVILLLENQWEEKNLELDIELDEVLFYGNQEFLSQVWINLIQNAIKFSPVHGIIAIQLKKESELAIVTIADQGIGISQEDGDKIFDRFYKADKSRSKEGNGLGLSIAKRIVEISSGRIFFESKPGEGTAFFVELPNKGCCH